MAGDHLFHITNWICCYNKAKLSITCLLLMQYSVFSCYFSQRVHIHTKGRRRHSWTFVYQITFQLERSPFHCHQEQITIVFCGSVCGSLLWCFRRLFRSAPLVLSCELLCCQCSCKIRVSYAWEKGTFRAVLHWCGVLSSHHLVSE